MGNPYPNDPAGKLGWSQDAATDGQGLGKGFEANNGQTVLGPTYSEFSDQAPPPADGGFQYVEPSYFQDPNQAAIYGLLGQGFDRTNQQAPQAQYQNLGQAATYNGAVMSPYAGSQAAQIAPQMMVSGATLDTAQDQQFAAAQASTANMLAAQAQGQGPSLATATADQQREANVAAQMAALGSQRGSSSAGTGLRQAQMGAAQAQGQASQQAVTGRAAEQLAAQQQLSGALQGARGQTQATATTQAQLAQQAALANQQGGNAAALQQAQLAQQAGQFNAGAYNASAVQQAQMLQQAGLANASAKNQFGLQQGQLDQQTALANLQAGTAQNQLNAQQYAQMMQMGIGYNQQDIANQIQMEQLLGQEELGVYGANAGVNINNTNNSYGMAGAGLAAGAAALSALSDRRAKTGIRSGVGDVRELLEAMDPDAQAIFEIVSRGG